MNKSVKQPTMTFLFEELDIPDLFWWKELDGIIYNFRNTIPRLNNALERTQGRVCRFYEVQPMIMQIQINTANRKTIAREMYDDLRHNVESRCNEVDKELITVRAKQWLADIEKENTPAPQQMIETVVVQLRRCFEPIDGGKYPHRPPYRDWEDWKDTDLDQYGYMMGNGRMTDKECEVLIEAYRDWAQEFQQNSSNNNIRNMDITLPKSLDKGDAKKYYDRALENGYMDWFEGKAAWKEIFAKLGYFCKKAYKQPRPINDLEKFFNVRKLSAAISQAGEAKRADVIAWRAEMDSLIFFD